MLNQRRRTVGVFSGYEAAAQAFDQLVLSGFPVAKTFLVGQFFPEELLTVSSVCSAARHQVLSRPNPEAIMGGALGLKKGILLGHLLGTKTGLVLGLGILALPGIGEVMLLNSLLFVLLSSGLFTVLGGLLGAMMGLTIAEAEANRYRQQVGQGNYLLVVDGNVTEFERARQLLSKPGMQTQ